MPRTVFSMLTTTPRRSPSEGASPTPMMLSPRSVGSPTTQQILVVPMSSAVTYLERGKHLSWNVGKNDWRPHYRALRPPRQHKLAVIHRCVPTLTLPTRGEENFLLRLQEMPPNDGDVVEDAHAEGHDGRQVEPGAQGPQRGEFRLQAGAIGTRHHLAEDDAPSPIGLGAEHLPAIELERHQGDFERGSKS